MRSDIIAFAKQLLIDSGSFETVTGLGCKKPKYPLARVWIPGAPKENIDNIPCPRVELRIAVQIETKLADDDNGNSIDGPLYNLVETAFSALQNEVPGDAGCQPFQVIDMPGIGEYRQNEPTTYLFQVAATVMPAAYKKITEEI